jgi:nucleotide-binding universal stress UspA family protein
MGSRVTVAEWGESQDHDAVGTQAGLPAWCGKEEVMAANSIVVATDGSRESVLSVEWAALEANRRGAPLRIVSTPAMPPRMRAGAYGSPETVADALQAASVQALATAAGRAAEVAPNVRVETGLLSGAPAQAIIDAASSASMLVVGARGTGGFAAMILGSVSRYAAMHAACPVVVAQGESLAVHQQIAVGVGDPDEAASALQFAFGEAVLRGVGLRVVHAWYWLPELRPVWAGGEAHTAGTGGTGLRRLDPELISAESGRQLAEMLASWREKYPHVQLSEDVIHGHPGQVLASLSAGSDLVVLGRHRRTTSGPPGIGSVQHAVLSHARGPIAIIPSAP